MDNIKLNTNKLSNNIWARTLNGIRYTYDIPTLIQFAKEKKYKVFDLPLISLGLDWNPFDYNNILDFIKHVKRVNESDLKYPILIDDLGIICDGWHRVVKAILEGKKYIKAIRLEEMPHPSSEEKI